MYSWQNMRDIWKAEKFDLIKFKSQFHEDFYCIEWRWQDGDEIVTNVALKKDGKLWRSVVSRIPISDTPPKIYEQDQLERLLGSGSKPE